MKTLLKKLLPLVILLFSMAAQAEPFDGIMVDGFDILSVRQAAPIPQWVIPHYTPEEASAILQKYNHLDPDRIVETEALSRAILYFHANQERIPNKKYITIINFHQHSGERRFYIINVSTGAVEALFTAHGSGSDKNNDGYADTFSNEENSHMSSLGFYLTAETYEGRNGYSLKMDGLSETNSKARERYVVMHKASYVTPDLPKMGMSWGCPALEVILYRRVIDTLKDGSLILAWTK